MAFKRIVISYRLLRKALDFVFSFRLDLFVVSSFSTHFDFSCESRSLCMKMKSQNVTAATVAVAVSAAAAAAAPYISKM